MSIPLQLLCFRSNANNTKFVITFIKEDFVSLVTFPTFADAQSLVKLNYHTITIGKGKPDMLPVNIKNVLITKF